MQMPMRFRRIPIQMADEVVVPGQIADEFLEQLMRFRRVPVQMADEVPESSRADS